MAAISPKGAIYRALILTAQCARNRPRWRLFGGLEESAKPLAHSPRPSLYQTLSLRLGDDSALLLELGLVNLAAREALLQDFHRS